MTTPASSRESRNGLELRGLTKRYGSTTALDELSFSVEPGETFGFVGANGAGKTTAMRIVLGVLEADAGEVFWGGKPLGAAERRKFGYMPEERGLYPKMKVGNHLVYLARLHGLSTGEAKSAARKWMERLGVAERSGDKVEALSLGNQQRVQLAAALIHDPEALVLDEPFSGLDPVGVDALSKVLAERAGEGVPVVFSSHQLELVERLCDSVAIINGGRLVAGGAVSELGGSGRVLRVSVKSRDHDRDGEPVPAAFWASGLAGVEITEEGDKGALLSLEDSVDGQTVLEAARAGGNVEHFGFEQRTLTEVFRGSIEG